MQFSTKILALSVCLSGFAVMHIYICVCVYGCISIYMYVSICLSTCLFVCLPFCLPAHLYVCLSVCLCLSVYLLACLPILLHKANNKTSHKTHLPNKDTSLMKTHTHLQGPNVYKSRKQLSTKNTFLDFQWSPVEVFPLYTYTHAHIHVHWTRVSFKGWVLVKIIPPYLQNLFLVVIYTYMYIHMAAPLSSPPPHPPHKDSPPKNLGE